MHATNHFPKLKKDTQSLIKELLLHFLKDDKLTIDEAREKAMNRRKEIIEEHRQNRSIWQNQTTGKWCTKLGPDKHLVVRKNKEDLHNAIVEYYLLNATAYSTFAEVFANWITYMGTSQTHSISTKNRYQNDYDRYFASHHFVTLPIADITEQELVRFLRALVSANKSLTMKRFSNLKTIIRGTFNHAKIEMDIKCISVKNIMDDILFPVGAFSIPKTETDLQVFKKRELELMKQHLKDSTNCRELGILLAMETGLRVGELCTLQHKDICGNRLKIERSEHKAQIDGKNTYFLGLPKENKIRYVQLSQSAKDILNQLADISTSEWLFPNPNNTDEWLHSYFFDRTIRRVCKDLNIPVRSMHKLRKIYCSVLLAQGVPEKLVQEQLGHADISTTQKAYHYNVFDTDEKENIFKDIKIG